MSLRETFNIVTGELRYFVNGKRVTRVTMNAIKATRRLDTFQTSTAGNLTRQFCEAR